MLVSHRLGPGYPEPRNRAIPNQKTETKQNFINIRANSIPIEPKNEIKQEPNTNYISKILIIFNFS